MMKGTTQLAPGWQRIGKNINFRHLEVYFLSEITYVPPSLFSPFVAQQISNFSVIKILIPENAQEI